MGSVLRVRVSSRSRSFLDGRVAICSKGKLVNPSSIEILATSLFAVAVLHTFLSSQFQHFAHKFPEGSVAENFFHMLGEVEVVFGLWAAVFLGVMALTIGGKGAVQYAESLNFAEPMFVFAVMAVAATKPVIATARRIIFVIGRLIPIGRETGTYASCLVIGPLLGSFITEPAAMTVTALILRDRYFDQEKSDRFRYLTLAVLFVNVSIGGVLTSFAAPPVLMVASTWNWNNVFMLQNFGWKAALAVVTNALLATYILRSELKVASSKDDKSDSSPLWLTVVHFIALGLIVATAHHPVIFIGIFLLFLGFATITREYQQELLLKQSLLVAFFLGGLVVLGGLQRWWLEPVLGGMSSTVLFFGSAALTAVTDNAAITYLGSQLPNVTDEFKYALVSGAVAGGGLTVIANAPNPAGFAILQNRFGPDGVSPVKLLVAAIVPTIVALLAFFLFWPS